MRFRNVILSLTLIFDNDVTNQILVINSVMFAVVHLNT